jgi:hypothetical protein
MRRLVTIALTGADLAAFEKHERAVSPLLQDHGARLEMRVRSTDGETETHLLLFPSAEAYEAYLSDPRRVAARLDWERVGVGGAYVGEGAAVAPPRLMLCISPTLPSRGG